MKIIFALSTLVLITFSIHSNAVANSNDCSNDLPKSMVAVAPFVWGSPDDEAPEYLRFVKAKFAEAKYAKANLNLLKPSTLKPILNLQKLNMLKLNMLKLNLLQLIQIC